MLRDGDAEKAPGNGDLEKAISGEETNVAVNEAPVLRRTNELQDDDVKTIWKDEEEGDLRPATASTAV